MSRLSEERKRSKVLEGICLEYKDAIHKGRYTQFINENPNLHAACAIYIFTHDADPKNLIFEIYSLFGDPHSKSVIPAVCKYLIRFFSESNELECTMALLRWMRDNGYTEENTEALRL